MITGVLNTLVTANTSDFDAKMASTGAKVGKLSSQVGTESSLIGRALQSLGNINISRIVGAFVGIGIAALAAAAAVAGFGVALHTMASRGAADIEHVYDLANNLELSIDALTAYGMMPGINGIEEVGNLIFRLQGQLDELTPRARQALDAMQIDPDELRIASTEQQVRMLAAGYQNLGSQVERVATMRALFGKGSMPMMDLLEGGTAALDRLDERVRRFGLDVSETQAKALRQANFEWQGFGLSIQGIGRQAAIAFAPLWEAMGRAGSDIGAWLVEKFRAAVPYIQTLLFVGIEFGAMLRRWVVAIKDWGAELIGKILPSATTFRDFFTEIAAIAIVSFRRFGDFWGVIIDTMQLQFMRFRRWIGQTIRDIATDVANMLPQAIRDRIDLNFNIPGLNVDQLTGDIDRLARSVEARRGDLNAMMAEERERLRALFQTAVRGTTQTLSDSISTGLIKAVTGHATILRGSEQAFSMLYGTRGNQDYYAKLQTDRLTDVRQLLIDVRSDFRQAPAIRRARL
jgi:hypothetical protein